MNENAERIKAAVSMDELIDTYGIEANRGGFVRCPFHDEKTPSLKIYPGDRGYHCFGCNQSGDVIDFVQHYFDMDFKAAIAKLDYDFNIGLPLSKPLSAHQRAEARRKYQRRLREKEARQAAEKAQDDKYWRLFDEWLWYAENSRIFAPRSTDDEFRPLFVEALKNKDHAEYLLDLHTKGGLPVGRTGDRCTGVFKG